MRKIKVVVLLVQQLQHGFTKNAKVSPNLTVAQMERFQMGNHSCRDAQSTEKSVFYGFWSLVSVYGIFFNLWPNLPIFCYSVWLLPPPPALHFRDRGILRSHAHTHHAHTHRIVRFMDRTIGCDWAKVRLICNFCYGVVALSRTIGEYGWQEPSQEIVRLASGSDQRPMYEQSWRPATNGTINRSLHPATDRTSNRGTLWPIVRALVISCDRAYDQSWHPKTDGAINRGMQRSIARSIVASCDRSYDQSWLPTTDRTIIRGTEQFGIACYKFWT